LAFAAIQIKISFDVFITADTEGLFHCRAAFAIAAVWPFSSLFASGLFPPPAQIFRHIFTSFIVQLARFAAGVSCDCCRRYAGFRRRLPLLLLAEGHYAAVTPPLILIFAITPGHAAAAYAAAVMPLPHIILLLLTPLLLATGYIHLLLL